MKQTLFTFTAVACLSISTLHAQHTVISAKSHFGTTGFEDLSKTIQTNDGNFLTVSCVQQSNNSHRDKIYGGYDVWVVKTSPNHQIVWEKNFGGSGNDFGYDIIEKPSGEIWVLAQSLSPSDGNKHAPTLGYEDIWVLRLAPDGKRISDFSFGTEASDYIGRNAMIQQANGNLVIAAYTSGDLEDAPTMENRGRLNAWVFEIDENGRKVNDAVFGGEQNELKPMLTNLPNGELLMTCRSTSGQSGNKNVENWGSDDVWMLKLNAKLQVIAETSFGGDNIDYFSKVVVHDNQIIGLGTSNSDVSGVKKSALVGQFDGIVAVFNVLDLSLMNDLSFGQSSHYTKWSNAVYIGNELVLVGVTDAGKGDVKTTENFGSYDVWMLGLGKDFLTAWDLSIGGDGTESEVIDVFAAEATFDLFFPSSSQAGGNLKMSNFGSSDIVHVTVNGRGVNGVPLLDESENLVKNDAISSSELSADVLPLIVFPNPLVNQLNVLNAQPESAYVVLDMNGKELLNGQLNDRQTTVSDLVPGVYYLVIEQQVLRFVKQ